MRAHKLNPTTGEILNTFEVPSLEYDPDLVDADLVGGGRGWIYDHVNKTVTAPVFVEPVPVSVSRFQAKAALLNAGLLNAFEALMIAPSTDPIARLAWVESAEFHRQSPTVLAMTLAGGLTSNQVDDLFRAAALIKA